MYICKYFKIKQLLNCNSKSQKNYGKKVTFETLVKVKRFRIKVMTY